MRACAAALFLSVALTAVVARGDVTYTFEGLTVDAGLAGQDNWGRDAYPNQLVQVGTGVNATTVSGNPSVTHGILYRINDAGWNYPAFTGTETNAKAEFDVTYSTIGGPHIMLAGDTNLDNYIAGSEAGPQFGIANDGKFYVRNAGFGAENQVPITTEGSPGDWFRVQLVTDFAANGGNGSSSLFYKNLTLGQSTFTPVAGLQNVDVNLTAGPAPSAWNAIMSRIDTPVSALATGAVSTYDNIVINGSANYGFEGLNVNKQLAGQGNWQLWSTVPTQDQTVKMGDGVNTTTVAGYPSTGIGIISRVNDANFSFPTFTGTETNVKLEAEIRVAAEGGPHIALGGDVDGSGSLSGASEVGPWFGIANNGQFYIRNAGFGAENQTPVAGEGVAIDDWVRVRMVVDFTANGGSGSASLFYKDLTRGDADFVPVAALQNIDINLSAAASPATWNGIITRTDGGLGQYDNIVIGFAGPVLMPDVNMDGVVNIFDINLVSSNWNTAGPAGDANKDGIVNIFDINLISANWTPAPAQAVPEPTTAVLLIVGAALIALVRRRVR